MRLATLLPHVAGMRVTRAEVIGAEVVLEVAARATSARCPVCRRRSRRVHG